MSNTQQLIMTRPCPSADELQNLATGNLPDPPAGEIESHVLECDACQQVTASLRLQDTFVDQVREAARIGEQSGATLGTDDEARVQRIIDHVSGMWSAEASDATQHTPLTTTDEELLPELAGWLQPAERDDEVGRLGDFRVLKLLGAGGMGVVFLAEDTQLQRRLALKTLKPEFAARKDSAERFLREARAAAAIKHEHVVTIYQVGQATVAGPSGPVMIPFLAQELLEGESLEDRLRRADDPLSMAEVIRIGREMVEGLAAAHAKGLIHRDIKPANVWLERSRHAPRDEPNASMTPGEHSTTDEEQTSLVHSAHHAERDGYVEQPRVKLLDFGLARSTAADSQLTSAGMILGTPSYMAPEQASGEAVDHRADLFSLGVVLYRMTTGQLPFPGKNVMETLKRLATVIPASPSSINPTVPRELSDLIDRLLQKDRDARPASAREVAAELRRSRSPVAPRLGFSESDSTTQVLSIPSCAAGNASRGTTRLRGLIAAAAMLLLGAVLFVQTRGGTLKIEAGDGIDASVVKEQVTIRDTVSGKTYEVSVGENSMRPGQYEIVLRDPASGLQVSTERVEIQRGGSTPLRITLETQLASKTPSPPVTRSVSEGEPALASKNPSPPTSLPASVQPGKDRAGRGEKEQPSAVAVNEQAASVLTGMRIGPVHNVLSGMIPRPARLPGIARWQAVTAGPRSVVWRLAWNKQGQILALESYQLRVLNAETLGLRKLLGPHDGNVSVSGDGRFTAIGGQILQGEEFAPVRVSSAPIISPDGKWLAGRGEGEKLVVESLDGTVVRKLDFTGPFPYTFCWSPDSRRLCAPEKDGTTVGIWNLDGTKAASFATGHKQAIGAMSWSPDGTLLATAHTYEVRIASVKAVATKADDPQAADQTLVIEPAGGPFDFGPIHTLAWSPDSQRLAIGTQGDVKFADRSGKEMARTTTTFANCHSLAWSPDSRELAAGHEHGMVVWTADGQFARGTSRPQNEHVGNVNAAWNRQGTLAVMSGDGTVRLWESSGQPGPLLDAPGTRIRTMAWHPDGNTLLTHAHAPGVYVNRLWSGDGKPGERLPPMPGFRFQWHSDGKRLVSYHPGGEQEFFVRDPANEQSVVVNAKTTIHSLACQPHGNLILGGLISDDPVRLWHDDGTPGPVLENVGPHHATYVAWHPTEPIFAASIHNKGIRIGNAEGKWLQRIGNGGCVAWSPDGRWLAAEDGAWISLRAADGGYGTVYRVPVNVAVEGVAITSLSWSPDSRSLAIGLPDHRVIVRDLFAEETKWVAQHLPPQLNAKGEVGRHGAAVVFSDAGELLHVAHSVAAKPAGPARSTAEPKVATLARAWAESQTNPRSGEPVEKRDSRSRDRQGADPNVEKTPLPDGRGSKPPTVSTDRGERGDSALLERYAELDGLIFMQVETLAEPGKTQILKPSEFVKLVATLVPPPSPSFDDAPLDQPVDLLALADPKPQRKLIDQQTYTDIRTAVPIPLDGEYDLTFSATAPAQPELLALGLSWRGRACEFFVSPRHSGLQRVAGQPSDKNETKLDGRLVSPGEKFELVCQVRHDGLTILHRGESLLEWHGDPARLSAGEGQPGLGNPQLTLRCSEGWAIQHWTLTPRGQGMSPAAALARANPTAVRQLIDDGFQLASTIRVFQGDVPAGTLLPANDQITALRGPLTHRALQAAGQMPNLELLGFGGGYLKPEFVPQLNQLTQVTTLYLRDLNLRDEDLTDLTLHDKLHGLDLIDNRLTLTDGLLDQIAKGRSLRSLDLADNPIPEESLLKLDRLVQLEGLGLVNCQVTDRVLDRLQTLPNLKGLNITATPATAARVEAFRQAKPNCQVEWSEKKP